MSGIINYIKSWFKSDKPKDDVNKLTVKGIQQEAKKLNTDNIKPFKYDESTELDLNQIMCVDSMKSDINDLTLNTSISSSDMSPNRELIDSSEINTQSISDNETIDNETIDNETINNETINEETIDKNNQIKDVNIDINSKQINLQPKQPQIITDVSETEKMINRIMKNAATETMKGGNYRTKYNKNNYILHIGGNEYCGKVNKQIYDSHKVDIGGY